jgi:hypothetical protein
MSEAMRSLAQPDATALVVNAIFDLANMSTSGN